MRSRSLLASLSAFWLAFCFMAPQVPIWADSTSNEPGPSVSSQSAVLSLPSLSAELLATLKDLKEAYPKLLEESENLRAQVSELSRQVSELSTESENWEAESKRLTDSLKSLMVQFEEYRLASQDRARIDAQAVELARGQRDILVWVAVICAVLGVIGWLM